jgi:uncharacterized phage-associated protein
MISEAHEPSDMPQIPPYDARAIANLLLDIAEQKKIALTQMSLLKLLYFAHGWYLTVNQQPLLKQEFEAWKYGPVVKVVRDEFNRFGKAPITERATVLDIFSGKRAPAEPDVGMADQGFVKAIFDSYHHYNAWKLSEMTHEEGSPWDQLWNSESPVGRIGLRIKNEEIKSHFDGLHRRIRLA